MQFKKQHPDGCVYIYIYAQLLSLFLLNTAFTNEYMVRQALTSQKIFFDGARGSTHEFLGLAGINHSAAAR